MTDKVTYIMLVTVSILSLACSVWACLWAGDLIHTQLFLITGLLFLVLSRQMEIGK